MVWVAFPPSLLASLRSLENLVLHLHGALSHMPLCICLFFQLQPDPPAPRARRENVIKVAQFMPPLLLCSACVIFCYYGRLRGFGFAFCWSMFAALDAQWLLYCHWVVILLVGFSIWFIKNLKFCWGFIFPPPFSCSLWGLATGVLGVGGFALGLQHYPDQASVSGVLPGHSQGFVWAWTLLLLCILWGKTRHPLLMSWNDCLISQGNQSGGWHLVLDTSSPTGASVCWGIDLRIITHFKIYKLTALLGCCVNLVWGPDGQAWYWVCMLQHYHSPLWMMPSRHEMAVGVLYGPGPPFQSGVCPMCFQLSGFELDSVNLPIDKMFLPLICSIIGL